VNSPGASDGRHQFVLLDGLRGVAALAVVITHASYFFPPTPMAYLAVDFFFMLSGFVLAHAYGERLRQGMTGARFMAIRLIRLYPLYALGTLLFMPILVRGMTVGTVGIGEGAADVLSAALFLPSPVAAFLYPLDPPAWSLCLELVANAMFGALAARLAGTLLRTIVAAGAVSMLLLLRTSIGSAGAWSDFWSGPPRVAFAFFAGVLLYQLWLKHPPRFAVPAPVIAIALALILFADPPHVYQRTFDGVMVLSVFPVLIWAGASCKPIPLLGRACTVAGDTSYAIYVLHFPLLLYLIKLRAPPNPLFGAAFLAALLAIAFLAHRYFDLPVRRRLMAWLASRPQVA
jgi:peptidoglycan/LPS O-acetylase OafA/YrhL